jgi:N-acetylmuramoyl-L-alanine amidase
MPKTYTVKQGDHLPGIAEENGFHDYSVVWNYADNADLKKLRQNPNVLYPGDEVMIPDLELREEAKSTDQHHKFQLNTSKLQLRLVLEDFYERPISGASCQVTIDGNSQTLTSNADGLVELDIPNDAKGGGVIINSDKTPFQNETIPVKIGYLDPADTVSGQKARLSNLGYYFGEIDSSEDDEFNSAIEEFQCDNDLVVDGICGPATQGKLKQIHGC